MITESTLIIDKSVSLLSQFDPSLPVSVSAPVATPPQQPENDMSKSSVATRNGSRKQDQTKGSRKGSSRGALSSAMSDDPRPLNPAVAAELANDMQLTPKPKSRRGSSKAKAKRSKSAQVVPEPVPEPEPAQEAKQDDEAVEAAEHIAEDNEQTEEDIEKAMQEAIAQQKQADEAKKSRKRKSSDKASSQRKKAKVKKAQVEVKQEAEPEPEIEAKEEKPETKAAVPRLPAKAKRHHVDRDSLSTDMLRRNINKPAVHKLKQLGSIARWEGQCASLTRMLVFSIASTYVHNASRVLFHAKRKKLTTSAVVYAADLNGQIIYNKPK